MPSTSILTLLVIEARDLPHFVKGSNVDLYIQFFRSLVAFDPLLPKFKSVVKSCLKLHVALKVSFDQIVGEET